MCHRNEVEKDTPWMDDLYLDIILLPSEEVSKKDADQLLE
ncbi:DUF402 domain-containing protein [Metabacillus bambusae]|nr:DUF402 domain-containing protein [Metabacillus bambusae]